MSETRSYHEVASCTGKVRFASATQAHQVVKRHNQRRRENNRCDAYRCKHCGGYHLGTHQR